MARSNAEVVREAFECFASGRFEAALELFSDQGVRRYFAGFEGQLEDVRYEPLEVIDRRRGCL